MKSANSMNNTITDIPGIKVGHAQDLNGITGCTVILCEKGAIGGVDQRGGAPGTREIALLNPVNMVESVHAILLAGGSAFGLDAASGVMRFLEERGIGFQTGVAKVPIVPAAILFDLNIGDPKCRPDDNMGYQACIESTNQVVEQGCIGAGTGATVGKILGMKQAMKSGVGSASIALGNGIVIGAIIAVNALGDVIDPSTGEIMAGARNIQLPSQKNLYLDTITFMRSKIGSSVFNFASKSNTVIGAVATNARFTKAQTTKLAQMAQNGIARAIRPANTMLDGDTIFALATGQKKANLDIVGAYAAEVTQQAILNAVLNATSLGGIPSVSSLIKNHG